MTPDMPDSNVPEASTRPTSVPAPATPAIPLEKADFRAQITPLLTDLLYPSESDEPIEVIETDVPGNEPLTIDLVKNWLKLSASVSVDEQPEADFWSPVITIEDWFGENEKVSANRFEQLKATVECLLTDRHVFRVGETEIATYLLGKPAGGPFTGLKTLVVET